MNLKKMGQNLVPGAKKCPKCQTQCIAWSHSPLWKFKTLKVSLLKNKTNSNLLTKISKFIDKELIKLDLLNTENFFFSERRQIHIIEQTRKYLNHALENFDEIEIACNYLNSAVKKLDELYGRNDPENKLGLIFSKFCIGK